MRKTEDYWVTFSKSGKVEDYLTFCTVKNNEVNKEKDDETQHERTYP